MIYVLLYILVIAFILNLSQQSVYIKLKKEQFVDHYKITHIICQNMVNAIFSKLLKMLLTKLISSIISCIPDGNL